MAQNSRSKEFVIDQVKLVNIIPDLPLPINISSSRIYLWSVATIVMVNQLSFVSFLQSKSNAAVTEFPDGSVPTTPRFQHSCAAIWTGLQQSVLLRETAAVLKSHSCQNSLLQSHPCTESSASVLWIRKIACHWKVRNENINKKTFII